MGGRDATRWAGGQGGHSDQHKVFALRSRATHSPFKRKSAYAWSFKPCNA